MSPFSVDIFFVWRYRKSSSGNPSVLCFRKLLVTKSFLDRNGSSRFSVAVFLSHSREKFHRVNLEFFENLLISKNFMDMGGGGETSRFSVKNLLFHSAGKILRAPFYCVTSFEYDISLCLKELCHDFLSVFSFRSTEKLGRETFRAVFHKTSGSEKIRYKRGGSIKIFR